MPGVSDAVRDLRRWGFRLGIVSTKFRSRIEPTLERACLLDRFDTIAGGEDVTKFKPDPEGLLMASERLAARLGEMVYVGDSVTDGETAQRAGVPFIALLSGMTPRHDLELYAPRTVLPDITALVEYLRPRGEPRL